MSQRGEGLDATNQLTWVVQIDLFPTWERRLRVRKWTWWVTLSRRRPSSLVASLMMSLMMKSLLCFTMNETGHRSPHRSKIYDKDSSINMTQEVIRIKHKLTIITSFWFLVIFIGLPFWVNATSLDRQILPSAAVKLWQPLHPVSTAWRPPAKANAGHFVVIVQPWAYRDHQRIRAIAIPPFSDCQTTVLL